MRATIYEYLTPNGGVKFSSDFELFAIKFFGMHGTGVVLSDSSTKIWHKWVALANEFSLDVSQNGARPTEPNPNRLSPIKLCALLAWTIWEARPVSAFVELTQNQIDSLNALGIQINLSNETLALRYPAQMLAMSLAENVFHRIQAGRNGELTYEHKGQPPYTDHYRKNLCIYLGRGDIGPEALYMIFKTMDLFGYLPTSQERIGGNGEPGRDTRRRPKSD